MAKLRIAIAGAGYFSRFQLEGWKCMADVEMVALCNRNEDKARARAATYGIPRTYTSLERMLDDSKPDLLDVITSPVTHNEYVRAAAARGIATICQKPFGANYADGVDIVGVAGRAGVPLIVHENFRFRPWYREAKRLADAGVSFV